MTISKCRAKNPSTCVHHGTPEQTQVKNLENKISSFFTEKSSAESDAKPVFAKVDLQTQQIANLLAAAPVYEKFATVKAEKITETRDVVTQFGDFIETENQGNVGDWIVTNPDGEQYVLSEENFNKRYVTTDEKQIFKPVGFIKAIPNPYHKNIEIVAPWGSPQFGDSNCWVAVTVTEDNQIIGSDRYIIEKDAFTNTYAVKAN